MFKNRMLLSDIDGTLLDNSHSISSENLNAVKRFTDGGGLFTLATGRTQLSVEKYVRKLPVNLPVILYNGAMIYDFAASEVLWSNPLDENTLESVQEIMREFPGAGIEIYTCDGVYVAAANSYTSSHMKRDDLPDGVWKLREIPFPWLKVLIAWDNEKLLEVEHWMKSRELPFRHTFSSSIFLELLDRKSSKGDAMLHLAELYKISRDDIFAVGDNMNDMEMIVSSSTGFAVGNAHPELLKAAAVIMPDNNSSAVAGAIDWIQRHVPAKSL